MKNVSLIAQHEGETHRTKVLLDRRRYLSKTKYVGATSYGIV